MVIFYDERKVNKNFQLEIHPQFKVELAAGEVVWHAILVIVNVCNPVVGVHVVKAKEVQTLHCNHYPLERFEETFAHPCILAFFTYTGESYIHTAIRGSTEA